MAGLPAESSSGSLGARLVLLTRRAPALVAMLLMALAGLGISIYLTAVHYQGVAPVCNTTSVINCATVTSSGNSVLFGTSIPITIPGMLWFVVSGGIAVVALLAIWRNRREPPRLRLAHLLWGLAGMVFVLYLVYAEIVLLHTLCEWCTAVHLLTFATFLLALNRWQQRGLPEPVLANVPVRSNGSTPLSANGKARRVPSATQQRAQSASNGSGSGRRSRH